MGFPCKRVESKNSENKMEVEQQVDENNAQMGDDSVKQATNNNIEKDINKIENEANLEEQKGRVAESAMGISDYAADEEDWIELNQDRITGMYTMRNVSKDDSDEDINKSEEVERGKKEGEKKFEDEKLTIQQGKVERKDEKPEDESGKKEEKLEIEGDDLTIQHEKVEIKDETLRDTDKKEEKQGIGGVKMKKLKAEKEKRDMRDRKEEKEKNDERGKKNDKRKKEEKEKGGVKGENKEKKIVRVQSGEKVKQIDIPIKIEKDREKRMDKEAKDKKTEKSWARSGQSKEDTPLIPEKRRKEIRKDLQADSLKKKRFTKIEFQNRSDHLRAERSFAEIEAKRLKQMEERGLNPSKGKRYDEERVMEYGVKSYLHNFYEQVHLKNPHMYEDIFVEETVPIDDTAKKKRQAHLCWRLSLFIGGVILIMGLTFLFIGYLTPQRKVIAGYHEGMEIINRNATKFNNNIKLCRIIGLALFCCGGSIFCVALLVSILNNSDLDQPTSEEDNLESFCIPILSEESLNSILDYKIPVIEKLTSVQPKQEGEEGVAMTNQGLCKAKR